MLRYFIILALLIFVSCKEKENDKKVSIAVTNYPLYWLVEKISAGSVNIIYNVPEHIDPAYWAPTDNDIIAMQNADLILLNGATYEKWISSVELPRNKTINTLKNHNDLFITIKNAETHEHNGVKHSHDGTDFNTWLDPKILKVQANEIFLQLVKLNPTMKDQLKTNLIELKKEITSVFNEIKKCSMKQKNYFASHPVYDYLAQVNNWKVINFHWEPESMPSNAEWDKLYSQLSHSKYMLYEDVPSKEISDKLSSMGITVIVFRTAGNTPPKKDLIIEMKANLKNLKDVLITK